MTREERVFRLSLLMEAVGESVTQEAMREAFNWEVGDVPVAPKSQRGDGETTANGDGTIHQGVDEPVSDSVDRGVVEERDVLLPVPPEPTVERHVLGHTPIEDVALIPGRRE